MANQEDSNLYINGTYNDVLKSLQPLPKFFLGAIFLLLYKKITVIYNLQLVKNLKRTLLIKKFAFFSLAGLLVSIFQFLCLTILSHTSPFLNLMGVEFLLPKIPIYNIQGRQWYFSLIGASVVYKDGVVITGGLGYYIATQISFLLAQIINFPIQRNIVFKSKGNIYKQILIYFFALIICSLTFNALNNLWIPLGIMYLPSIIYNLLNIILISWIAAVIYFFVFMWIFPSFNTIKSRFTKKILKMRKSGLCCERKLLYMVSHNKKTINLIKAQQDKTILKQLLKSKTKLAIMCEYYLKQSQSSKTTETHKVDSLDRLSNIVTMYYITEFILFVQNNSSTICI